jgi:Flp pilus assembly protein TadD
VALGELDNPGKAPILWDDAARSLAEKKGQWDENHTIWHAADFIAASFVLGEPEASADAAGFLLSQGGKKVPVPALLLAGRVAHQEAARLAVPEVEAFEGIKLFREIHRLKQRTVTEPRNAIAWVDLARAYTVAGEINLARRAIVLACSISPDNRFVLRSAARLLVHQHDAFEAHRLLVKSVSTGYDPWLMAAEIGVASTAGLGPVFTRPARGVLGSAQHSPLSLTELSSALASLELDAGKIGSAKKLFRKSLERPTENSLAQASWASEHVSGLHVNARDFEIPRNFEADAWQSYALGEWDQCLHASVRWLEDQPFSSKPAVLASFILSTINQNYEAAVALLKTSMTRNPRHPGLTNNLAFALVNLGNLEEAQLLLSSAKVTDSSDASNVTLLATEGALMFRSGNTELGRHLYLDAIELARRQRLQKYVAMGAIYLAHEEVLARTEQKSVAIHRAVEESAKCADKDVAFLLNRVQQLLEYDTDNLR